MLDNTDREILAILQQNARETIKSIGEKVGLSAPAAAERIKKLEQEKVITGYKAVVNPHKLGKNLEAFIVVNTNIDHEKAFYKLCENHNDIVSYKRIIGNYSTMLHVFTESSLALELLIDEIKKYGTTQTVIVLPKGGQTKFIK